MATRMATDDYKKLLIRIPPALHRYLEALSHEEDRSVNGTLVHIVRQYAETHPLEGDTTRPRTPLVPRRASAGRY
jgi:hypothetical protein